MCVCIQSVRTEVLCYSCPCASKRMDAFDQLLCKLQIFDRFDWQSKTFALYAFVYTILVKNHSTCSEQFQLHECFSDITTSIYVRVWECLCAADHVLRWTLVWINWISSTIYAYGSTEALILCSCSDTTLYDWFGESFVYNAICHRYPRPSLST